MFPRKNIKKKVAAKKITEKPKEKKEATAKKGLCVCFLFVSAVVLCDYLCV
jgi:hypothetical protein